MVLFEKIKKTLGLSTEEREYPSATFATRPDSLYAPINGVLVELSEIGDETISSGLFGRGYGIVPVGNVIYAPASGRIAATTVSNHSIGIRTDSGIELIIHVGIGIVKLEGKGFKRLVESEQRVAAGEPILVFDDEAIKAAGYDDVITVIVTSPSLLDKVKLVGQSNTLFAGHPLVKVGDPLVIVKE